MKKTISALLIFIFSFSSCFKSFASTTYTVSSPINKINSVDALDLSKNLIKGQKADFSIKIPSSWDNYIIAERENINYRTKLLEKINFYYDPQNNISKPLFLMSMYIYNKSDWDSTLNYTKLIETKKYVFAMYNAETNPFTNQTDKALFTRFLSETNSIDFVKSLIIVNDTLKPTSTNTITVNNKLLKTRVVYKENSVVYVPIRETCEALGYEVLWREKNKSILISSDKFSSQLFTDNNKNIAFSVVLINNISFVSSMYLIKNLKCSIEVDENSNVFISN